MYTLFRSMSIQRLLLEQAPALASAWIIAELFFKFQSFTLECAAFLATWFVFDAFAQLLLRRLKGA